MQNNTKLSKNVFFKIIIFFIILLCTFEYLSLFKYQNIDILITATTEKNTLSNSNEIWITEIKVDDKKLDLNSIELPSDWNYDENSHRIFIVPNEKSNLNLTFTPSKNLEITFLTHPWSGIVQINNKNIDLYSKNTSTFTYSESSGKILKPLQNIFITLCIYLLAVYFIYKILNLLYIKRNSKFYFMVYTLLILLNGILCKYSNIFNNNILLTFLLLSIYCFIIFYQKHKHINLKIYDLNLGIFFINLYITFSFVGDYIFLSSKISNISIKFQIFFIFNLIFYPIINLILYFFNQIVSYKNNINSIISKKKPINITIKCFSLCVLIQIFALLIFNPGLMTADTFMQYSQIHGYTNFTEHHPLFHTFLEKVLYDIWDSPYIISLFQILFSSIVLSLIAKFLYEIGYELKYIYIFLIIFNLLPNNFINIITQWKDIPFTISMMYLTYLLCKISLYKIDFFNSYSNIVQLSIITSCIGLFRHNGIVVTLGILLLLIVLYFYSSYKRVLSSVILILMLTIGTNSLLPIILNASPNGNIATIIPFHGIAFVSSHGDLDNENTIDYLEEYMPINDINSQFNLYSGNPYMYGEIPEKYNTLEKFRNSNIKETLMHYLITFTEHPLLIIKERLCGTDLLWNVTENKGGNYRYATFTDIDNNIYGIKHYNPHISDAYYNLLKLTSIKFIDMFLWRSGIYIDFSILIAYFLIKKKQYIYLLPFCPLILNALSLLLSMAWQDYRYVYFSFTSTVVIILFVFSPKIKTNHLQSKEELI